MSKPVDFQKHSEQKIKFTVLTLFIGLLCLTSLHIVSLVDKAACSFRFNTKMLSFQLNATL